MGKNILVEFALSLAVIIIWALSIRFSFNALLDTGMALFPGVLFYIFFTYIAVHIKRTLTSRLAVEGADTGVFGFAAVFIVIASVIFVVASNRSNNDSCHVLMKAANDFVDRQEEYFKKHKSYAINIHDADLHFKMITGVTIEPVGVTNTEYLFTVAHDGCRESPITLDSKKKRHYPANVYGPP